MKKIKLIECPRDAMQGYSKFVESEKKINYINNLLKVGFYAIDCGSFVSEKMVPQMSDTPYVIKSLNKGKSKTKIIVIVANERGALDASNYNQIDILGYPFSISENFQIRNTNKTTKESINVLNNIIEISDKTNKEVVVYLSMAYGNPYGDPWNIEIVLDWIHKLKLLGIKTISLSDTIGISKTNQIKKLFKAVNSEYREIEFGAHFHSMPNEWYNKIKSAYSSGCNRFDGTIMGYGGCPMASNRLIGNIATEKLITFFNNKENNINLNISRFENAINNFRALIKF
ncbi:MAG: hydroxymethylglutaryl-CoA lyase [Flavobacteriaceae bacterium]|nr:hydroxymethylglutaryl-CoA lyase [Flavobacteriaceae bacterium]|tara:strand:- start:5641 stop:6498 length:858 start_codon:yes stop_codon:yes gene_type:complete